MSNWRAAPRAGALAIASVPASAAILTLPIIGDIEHPDLDPFHVLSPPASETPAPAATKTMKPYKKMMKHKMKKTM